MSTVFELEPPPLELEPPALLELLLEPQAASASSVITSPKAVSPIRILIVLLSDSPSRGSASAHPNAAGGRIKASKRRFNRIRIEGFGNCAPTPRQTRSALAGPCAGARPADVPTASSLLAIGARSQSARCARRRRPGRV